MRMFSVLVNSGGDPTLEDNMGHNAQYYMDNQTEIVIPEWTNRWSNMITAQDRSPSPERRHEQINYRTVTCTHCSYLDIYISQKIRLCVVDLEGKFQTIIQAKLINFLVWKFRSIIRTHFSSIFCRICQIHCFLHTVAAI